MRPIGQIPKWALEKAELSISQQPRAPQPKLKYPCCSKYILLGRKAIKTQVLYGIGGTTIKNHVFISTKNLWKLRNKPTPQPKMKKSPQQIKCSSTLSQIGQVRHLSFACNCQTHGDVDHLLLPWDQLAKSPSGLWKSLNCPHLNNQEPHNQNSNIYVVLNAWW